MSLIFDALKQEREAPREPAPAAGAPALAVLPWRVVGLVLLLGGLGVVALGWPRLSGEAAAPRQADAAPAAPLSAVTVAAAPVAQTAPPAPVEPAPQSAPVAPERTAPVEPAPTPAPMQAARAPAAPASNEAAKGVATAAPEPSRRAPRVLSGAPVQVSSEVVELDIQSAFQTFLAQTQAADWAAARQTQDSVLLALGPEHVMSLRMQAYLALRQSELDKARRHYQRLLERLPDDREAGLNVALIDWRQGQQDAARKRLAGLADRFPADPEIRAMILNLRQPAAAW